MNGMGMSRRVCPVCGVAEGMFHEKGCTHTRDYSDISPSTRQAAGEDIPVDSALGKRVKQLFYNDDWTPKMAAIPVMPPPPKMLADMSAAELGEALYDDQYDMGAIVELVHRAAKLASIEKEITMNNETGCEPKPLTGLDEMANLQREIACIIAQIREHVATALSLVSNPIPAIAPPTGSPASTEGAFGHCLTTMLEQLRDLDNVRSDLAAFLQLMGGPRPDIIKQP